MGDKAIDIAEALEVMDGDRELLVECFEDLLNAIPESLENISVAISSGDFEKLDEAAHKIKGSFRYLGAGPAADAAYKLEVMGKENSMGSAGEVLENLKDECRKVEEFISQYDG